jgi:hypothetical protein
MSLLTLSEVRGILCIPTADTTKDVSITVLIPNVIEFACQTLRTRFQGTISNISSNISFAGTGKTITDSDSGFSLFLTSMDVYVSGSRVNDGFYTINTLTSSVMTVNETLKDEPVNNEIQIYNVVIPQAVKLTLAKIIAHFLQKDKVGYKSFSVGSLNWNYANAGAIPQELISELYQSAGRASVGGV